VAKLADAQDLKSWAPQGACGFDPHPRHHQLPPVESCAAIAPENSPVSDPTIEAIARQFGAQPTRMGQVGRGAGGLLWGGRSDARTKLGKPCGRRAIGLSPRVVGPVDRLVSDSAGRERASLAVLLQPGHRNGALLVCEQRPPPVIQDHRLDG
jgi:hypothetical protein